MLLNDVVVVYSCPVPKKDWFPKLPNPYVYPEPTRPYPETEEEMKKHTKEILEMLEKFKKQTRCGEGSSTDLQQLLDLLKLFRIEFVVEYKSEETIVGLHDLLFFYFDKNEKFETLKERDKLTSSSLF